MRSNIIEFEIIGRSAMFIDPTNIQGRSHSLPVPTYEAIKGILRSVYWKPTFIWVPDDVRIMSEIRTGRYPVKFRNGSVIEQERLIDVRYQVRAHFVWNMNRPEFAADRNEDKHFRIALRSLNCGGRYPVYLGRNDCPGELRPARFGSGNGSYDTSDRVEFGSIYHGTTFPDEGWDDRSRRGIYRRKWYCAMNGGVIHFIQPQLCSAEFVCGAEPKRFLNNNAEGDFCAAGTQN